MKRLVLLGALILAAAAPARAFAADPFDRVVADDLAFARSRLATSAGEVPASAYPYLTDSAGRWVTREPGWWTSGFFPGLLWRAYDETRDPFWRSQAQLRQAGLESQKNNSSTHDVGFIVFSSFGNAYKLTRTDAYRQVVLKAAQSLATRYSPVVGATRSWGNSSSPDFTVIVDNLMNLELLFWGARNGGNPAWRSMAVTHALTTLRDHVRPDGSTYHVVDYDPATGAVRRKRTVQGLATESTWARGQTWAIYGFTVAYRETRDARFLTAARRTADWFLARLPADSVPYWDFQATGPGQPRDSSAAAIAASGLIELASLEPDRSRAGRYRAAAKKILLSLSSPAYLSKATANRAILLHGTANKPAGQFDSGLIYGDYYFVEALLRWRATEPGGAPTTALTLERPRLRLRVPRNKRRLERVLRRGLPVQVRSNRAGKLTASLYRARRIGRRARQLTRPRTVKVIVHLTRKARRRLRHARSVRTILEVRLVTPDNERATGRLRLRLRSASRR